MHLLIIRHGESDGDILKRCEGRADYELTARGQIQVENTSQYLNEHYNITKIYSSPLKRAYQTAKILQNGQPLILDDNLMEFNNGLRAGLPYSEAYRKYPQVNVAIHEAKYNQESLLEFRY